MNSCLLVSVEERSLCTKAVTRHLGKPRAVLAGCSFWKGTGSLPHGERFEAWYSFSVSG